MLKTEMSSLWQVMNTLRDRGYKLDFNMSGDGRVLCSSTNRKYRPEEVFIDKVYRFEGDSDPGDMSVMYAIHSTYGDKGLYVDGYGANAGQEGMAFNEFIKRVKIKRYLFKPFLQQIGRIFRRVMEFIRSLFS